MILSYIARLLNDRAGNFGIMTAVLLPVLLGAAGVAIDITSAMQTRSALQGLTDAAALATAAAMADKDMTSAEAQAFAAHYFVAQAAQITADANETAAAKAAREAKLKSGISVTATTASSSGAGQTFNVTMTMRFDVQLTGLSNVIGLRTMQVSVSSTSQSGRQGNALSMYLALDESGSMAELTTTVNPAQPTIQQPYKCGFFNLQTCYRTVNNYLSKMASLKAAAAGMFLELKKVDPKSELVRMGAVSYDDKTKTAAPIQWGTSAVASYVAALPDDPKDGTDASGAMTIALNAILGSNPTEKTEQLKKHNTSFERFIVLMTDGEMTGDSSAWNSGIDSKVRTLCKQAKDDGIKVYTVAFMAPTRGKSLLSACASGSDYYYHPEDMNSLIKSFGDIARKAAKTGTRLTN